MKNNRQLLNEMYLAQPNNPKEILLHIDSDPGQSFDKDQEPDPEVTIYDKETKKSEPKFNAQDIAIIEKHCPEAIFTNKNQEKSLDFTMTNSEIDSDEGQDLLQRLVDGINEIGRFGQLSLDDLLASIGSTKDEQLTPDKKRQLTQSAQEMFNHYALNFLDPEVQKELAKIHVFTPMGNYGKQLTMKNVHLIEAQNKKRTAAGLPAATYLLSPEMWLHYYQHKVNPGAQPIFYWAPHDSGYDESSAAASISYVEQKPYSGNNAIGYIDSKDTAYTADAHRNLKYTASRFKTPTKTNFFLYPYYDITDTTYIGEGEDPFIKREGVMNNIYNNELTPLSQQQFQQDNPDQAEEATAYQNDAFKDDPYVAIETYNALCTISQRFKNSKFKGSKPVTLEDGKANIDSIKSATFQGLVELASDLLAIKHTKDSNRIPKAILAASIYAGITKIDNDRAKQQWADINGVETMPVGMVDGKEVELTKIGTDEDGNPKYIYYVGSTPVAYTGDTPKDMGLVYAILKKGSEVSTTIQHMMYAINDQISKDIEDGITQDARVSIPSQTNVSESYMYNGMYENGNDGSHGDPAFESLMLRIYNMMCDNQEEEGSEETEPINEGSEDDWFAPEYEIEDPFRLEDDKNAQDLNDFFNQDFSLENEENRQLAENKFYDILNRITNLY